MGEETGRLEPTPLQAERRIDPPRICLYCNTINPAGEENCIACGAPGLRAIPQPDVVPVVSLKKPEITPADLRKVTKTVDDTYTAGLQIYSLAWRTVGEALAIAVVGFALGLIGGATGMPAWGVLGAVLVGLLVGLTCRNFWFTALGAPLGALLGTALWVLPLAFGAGPRGMVFSATLLAAAGSQVGRYPHSAQKNWWEKLRPFLGAVGGLVFALLGTLLGLGIARLLPQ